MKCDYDYTAAENIRLKRDLARLKSKSKTNKKIIDDNLLQDGDLHDLYENLVANLSKYKFTTTRTKAKPLANQNQVVIVQLADLHLNERVDLEDTLGFNRSDYGVAAQRLKKYNTYVKHFAESFGAKNILIVNTGDVLNSDRRKDELLTNADNRSKAVIVAVDLLQQFINDFVQDGYHVEFASVCGNESRLDEHITWNNVTFSNNYDQQIHDFLKLMFRDTDVVFHSTANAFEVCINVCGKNIVFMHGHALDNKKMESAAGKVFAKYAQAGILINYVICGHYHSTQLADFYSRSSGLVGDNSFSNNAMQLKGKAAQNIYIVDTRDIHAVKVDLQYATDFTPYKYDYTVAAGSEQRKAKTKRSIDSFVRIIKHI